jgi:hypothetical protein
VLATLGSHRTAGWHGDADGRDAPDRSWTAAPTADAERVLLPVNREAVISHDCHLRQQRGLGREGVGSEWLKRVWKQLSSCSSLSSARSAFAVGCAMSGKAGPDRGDCAQAMGREDLVDERDVISGQGRQVDRFADQLGYAVQSGTDLDTQLRMLSARQPVQLRPKSMAADG